MEAEAVSMLGHNRRCDSVSARIYILFWNIRRTCLRGLKRKWTRVVKIYDMYRSRASDVKVETDKPIISIISFSECPATLYKTPNSKRLFFKHILRVLLTMHDLSGGVSLPEIYLYIAIGVTPSSARWQYVALRRREVGLVKCIYLLD